MEIQFSYCQILYGNIACIYTMDLVMELQIPYGSHYFFPIILPVNATY